jgi:hypothetical protein
MRYAPESPRGHKENNMERDFEAGWRPWPVWSAVWVGALSALAVGLIIGLIGYAVGAHQLAGPRTMTFKNVRMLTMIFNVAGAFFAFVVGGWVAARIVGARRAETAMLHGAVAWLVTIPMMLVLGALGATAMYGSWYSGLVAGTPTWATTAPSTPELAAAVRNSALATVGAMLLGLLGSVIGGWMASGEPMRLTYYRTREADFDRPRRVA